MTDLNARHWDMAKKEYVTGPVVTHAFLQFAGRHPDLNKNGVDDYIDMLNRQIKRGVFIPEKTQPKR